TAQPGLRALAGDTGIGVFTRPPSRLPRLQAVVPELGAGDVQPLAAAHRVADRILGAADLLRRIEDRVFVLPGKHHRAIRVAAQDVARGHPDAANGGRAVDGRHLDAVLAGTHPAA